MTLESTKWLGRKNLRDDAPFSLSLLLSKEFDWIVNFRFQSPLVSHNGAASQGSLASLLVVDPVCVWHRIRKRCMKCKWRKNRWIRKAGSKTGSHWSGCYENNAQAPWTLPSCYDIPPGRFWETHWVRGNPSMTFLRRKVETFIVELKVK